MPVSSLGTEKVGSALNRSWSRALLLRLRAARIEERREELERGLLAVLDGADGAAEVVRHLALREAALISEEQDAARNNMVQMIREQISPEIAAGWDFIDDLIDPADTRAIVTRALANASTKTVERPWRKHGVLPV